MSNKDVLKKGREIAMMAIEKKLKAIGKDLAIYALLEAVKAWDEETDVNLTGNTRFGFCSAVYYDNKLFVGPYFLFDFEGGKPTNGMTAVGRKGFHDYDSGTWIGSEKDPVVMEYKHPYYRFQPTSEGKYSYEMTANWLRSHRPGTKGMVVTVANMTPYADYLREVRGLDVLESQSDISVIKKNIDSVIWMHSLDR